MINCLPKEYAERIKKAILDGVLSPAKMSKMTSKERRDFLAGFVGAEHAKNINLQFENKLLLKNQERAMYDWARNVLGLSKEQKQATLDKIRATYAEKKRRLQDPKENEVFLNEIVSDVYSKKYKTEVMLEEAQIITELTQQARKFKEKMRDNFTWPTKEDGLNFGAAEVALKNYLNKLKSEAKREKFLDPRQVRNVEELINTLKHNASFSFDFIASTARTLVTTLDNSLWGRQGIEAFFTHHKVWRKHFIQSFRDINKIIRRGTDTGEAIVDATRADAFSRKNYLNGRYNLGTKLDIEVTEEDILTDRLSRIPILGRGFKAANVAFEAGAIRLRIDIADKIYDLAEQVGIDMESKHEIGSINRLVNSMTGRGALGRLEAAGPILNKLFFSVRFFKSNLDTLTAHFLTGESSFAQKQARNNILKIVAGIGSILLIANTLDDETVEWDPRSANFGKIRIGNMRFDVTGGMGGLVILAARLATQSTKSPTTGVVKHFRDGFAAPTGMDVLWNFTEGRFSPMFSVIKELVDQRTFEGEDPTIMSSLVGLTAPIVWEGAVDAYRKEGLSNALLVLMADSLGISANLYTYGRNWQQNTGKELLRFREAVGEKRFREANEEYNKRIDENLQKLKETEKWKKASDDEKNKKILEDNRKIKERVLKEFLR